MNELDLKHPMWGGEKVGAPTAVPVGVMSLIALWVQSRLRGYVHAMSGVVKRSASQAVKSSPSRRGQTRGDSSLPRFIPPQLSQPVEKPPSRPQWLHEIKLDGFRMAARIDNGRAQLLTRTGLDWTDKYPSIIAALDELRRGGVVILLRA